MSDSEVARLLQLAHDYAASRSDAAWDAFEAALRAALTPPQHDMERFSEQSRRLALAIVEGVRQYPDMALDAVAAYVEGSVVELCNRSGVAAPPPDTRRHDVSLLDRRAQLSRSGTGGLRD